MSMVRKEIKVKVKRLSEFRCDIPEMESENYRIKKFVVTEEDAKRFNLRALISFSSGGRTIETGEYMGLWHKKQQHNPLMSDTPVEVRDHVEFIRKAEGNILINGLGLGFALDACLFKTRQQPLPYYYISPKEERNIKRRKPIPIVEHATVIEISQELIDLVTPYYRQKYPNRMAVICADALDYTFSNGQKFDAVWHDIWPTICEDNLPDMRKLHRKYGKRAKWQGSWCRWECEKRARS